MGNVIESFASGFGQAVGKLFNSPLEFLSGKSCSSLCGPTWDLFCYIENFCVANLLRLAMVFVLLYIVLLFFYLLHKLGICGCLGRSFCNMIWACFSSCFHILEYSCSFFCVKLFRSRRRRVRMGTHQKFYSRTGDDYTDESLSYHFPTYARMGRSFSRRRRDYKGSHLRKSLRPRIDHARVEINRDFSYKNRRNHRSGDSGYASSAIKHGNHRETVHDVKVTRTSKFARKGINNRKIVLRRQKRPSMERDEGKQSSHKNPYVELEEVSYDFILAIGLQEQERTFTMLETIESETDEYVSESSFDDHDAGDADFLESQEFEGEGSNDDDEEMEMEEDEIDPDELSYEELIDLGEFIGKEMTGLSANEISSCLHPYTCQSAAIKGGIDRCVICQVEHEEGEALVALDCEHPYHADCISKWLQIKKVCPICSNEVSTPNMAKNP